MHPPSCVSHCPRSPRRQLPQIPGLPTVLSSHTPTSHPGLLGICLSGAGPTVLALATDNFQKIGDSIRDTFKAEGVDVDWSVLEVCGGSEIKEGGVIVGPK